MIQEGGDMQRQQQQTNRNTATAPFGPTQPMHLENGRQLKIDDNRQVTAAKKSNADLVDDTWDLIEKHEEI